MTRLDRMLLDMKLGGSGPSRGNRHFTARRDGPVCPDCGEDWRPMCTTRDCPGFRGPWRVIQAERGRGDARRFGNKR